MPFDLKVGHVGNINVQIPWRNLTTAPLIIEISEIFIQLDPKPTERWNVDDMWKVYWDACKVALQNFEMYTRMEFEKPKLGVAEKLISTIVNNV